MTTKNNHPLLNTRCRCHICDGETVALMPGYEGFRRVTSDCQPWPAGGRLGICQTCGCVQKIIDPQWESEVGEIYQAYAVYHQSSGAEQSVFDENSGTASPRSARLLSRLQQQINLPEKGRLLDVGCANGTLLRSFNKMAPQWTLVGTELNDKYRAIVENIDQVEAFFTCFPDQVPGKFNLITMLHVLEHIPAPVEFLTKLSEKLDHDGWLFLEIPNYRQNPFDLLISDHCTHFTDMTIMEILCRAGYEVLIISNDWVPKELSVVARKMRHPEPAKELTGLPASDSIRKCLQWLEAVRNTARNLGSTGPFGIFGTSIAATWLLSELNDQVSFFVDEDPQRVGKMFWGHPIYHPVQIPQGSKVFIALPYNLSKSIWQRLRKSQENMELYLPPAQPLND